MAGGAYAGTLRRTILAYKHGRRDVGEALAAWLAERCGPIDPTAVLVPVPTTAFRRAERGFDQSVRLARRLSVFRERPVLLALRHRAGDAQRGRTRAARLAARDRFACVADDVLCGVRIVLVDDVVTTGATLADSARTLRARGAVVEDAVVLASARLPSLGAGPAGGERAVARARSRHGKGNVERRDDRRELEDRSR